MSEIPQRHIWVPHYRQARLKPDSLLSYYKNQSEVTDIGMLAILIPWSHIGTEVEFYVPSNIIPQASTSEPTAVLLEKIDNTISLSIVAICISIGIVWLLCSIN